MAKFQNGIDLWKIRDKGQLRNYVTYRRNFKLDIRDLKINYDTKKFKTAGPKCISADGVNRGKLYYHILPYTPETRFSEHGCQTTFVH